MVLVGSKLVTAIAVFNVGGSYFAFVNRCPIPPHRCAVAGFVRPAEVTGPGQFWLAKDRPVLRWPWHGWQFELRSGESWERSPDSLRTQLSRSGRRGAAKGQCVAETFQVYVDGKRHKRGGDSPSHRFQRTDRLVAFLCSLRRYFRRAVMIVPSCK